MVEAPALAAIQKLQFSDKERAEKELLTLLRQRQDLAIKQVELLPKPESLNSINGFITLADQRRYFFKAHVEENEQVSEYYNAVTLADAGYPVITPRQIDHIPGQQLVLYEVVSYPTLFDVLKQEEDGASATPMQQMLVDAQVQLDKTTAEIYEKTLGETTAEHDAKAPIHQLFYHRLAVDGRLGLFYKDGRSADASGRSAGFQPAPG
ncbi:MAG: hypothetical protein ACRD3W_05690, partial [Terriglobales bacterium]